MKSAVLTEHKSESIVFSYDARTRNKMHSHTDYYWLRELNVYSYFLKRILALLLHY